MAVLSEMVVVVAAAPVVMLIKLMMVLVEVSAMAMGGSTAVFLLESLGRVWGQGQE